MEANPNVRGKMKGSNRRGGDKMVVKHTPTEIVHKGTKGGKTGCGYDTKEKASHWVNSNERVNCEKKGCK